MLLHSEARQSYWNLSVQFLTQKTQSFCGVASIVMVLNALGVPAPTTPEYRPYTVFTQENFFNDQTEEVLVTGRCSGDEINFEGTLKRDHILRMQGTLHKKAGEEMF